MNRLFREIIARLRIDPLGVAMPGPRLPHRIRQIVTGCAAPRISGLRTASIGLVCTALCVASTAGRLGSEDGSMPRAQTQAAPLSFEVASVKPNKSGSERAPSLILPGGRFTATNNTVRDLILNAYGIWVSPYLLKGGPAWIDSERYDIDASAGSGVIPAGTPNRVLWEKTRLMLQTLLAERFKLSIHRESREMDLYELTVGKNGPKLQKSDADCNASAFACHGFSGGPVAGLSGTGVDMYDLALELSSRSDRPVVDRTGIQGIFNVELQWDNRTLAIGSQPPHDASQSPGPEAKEGTGTIRDRASLPTLSEALDQELGLKLVSTKGPIEIYVIDHIEQPSPN